MRFGVWAPLAGKSVTLVRGGVRHAMERAEDGWWHTDQEAEPGSSYTFILDDGEPRADPRALSLPEGPEGSSQVMDMYQLVVETVPWRGVHHRAARGRRGPPREA